MPDYSAQLLDSGITCIDAEYVQAGLACFYLLQEGEELAVLETGTSHSVPRLQALLQDRGIAVERVRYVIPTHVHLDDAGGAGLLNMPVLCCCSGPRLQHPRAPDRNRNIVYSKCICLLLL